MPRNNRGPSRRSKRDGLSEETLKKNDPPEEMKKISDSNLPHLFNLAFKVADWLHTLWNYYFVIVTAIIGWILTKSPGWNQRQANVFCVVFGLASAVNWILILYNFGLLKRVLKAVEKEFEAGTFFRFRELDCYLRSISRRVWWRHILYAFHVVLDLFVIISIQSLTR